MSQVEFPSNGSTAPGYLDSDFRERDSNYYIMPHCKPDFTKVEAPVLGHFGTADDFVSVDDAKALSKR